jgi:hypothetical protein
MDVGAGFVGDHGWDENDNCLRLELEHTLFTGVGR